MDASQNDSPRDVPTTATDGTATSADGVRIRFRVEGHGVAVLLLHGFSDSLDSWWEVGVAPVLARTFRVVALDLRGHGGSDKPSDPARYRDEHRAADVVAVLDAIGERSSYLVGYSMGGWTALAVARLVPARVRALAIGGAHPYAQSLGLVRQAVAAGADTWLSVVAASWGTLPEGFVARFARNDPVALAAAVAEDRPDVSNGLHATSPTLWFAGDRDPMRRRVERAAAAYGGRFVLIPDADHFTALASPLLATTLRDFLANTTHITKGEHP